MSSEFGSLLKISVFGQSHGRAIGVVVDGLPAGEAIDLEELNAFLARRKPGKSPLSTARREADAPVFLSGLENGVTINVIDTSVLGKTLFELHKHGVNLNQLMKFCNTYGLDAFNESHVIPILENERDAFARTQAALSSIAEEAWKGNVVVNLEMSDDMEEEIEDGDS